LEKKVASFKTVIITRSTRVIMERGKQEEEKMLIPNYSVTKRKWKPKSEYL